MYSNRFIPSTPGRIRVRIAALVLSLLLCLPHLPARAQSKGKAHTGALQTSRKVADKVIRETRFEYRQVPLSYNGGVSSFQLEEGIAGTLHYVSGILESAETGSGYLGLAHRGAIKVFLNGEEIYRGVAEAEELREYTYNRYRFQHKLPVDWQEGENRILVKCLTGEGAIRVLIQPQNELDEKDARVNMRPLSEDLPLEQWMGCGPWSCENGDGMDKVLAPEKEWATAYTAGELHLAWQSLGVAMLQELVIPEDNSYLRDAYGDWHYANGGTMLAILSLYELSEDEAYLNFVKAFAGNLLENKAYFQWQYEELHAMRGSFHRLFRMTMLDDSGGPALPLAQLQLLDPESDQYQTVLDTVFDYVMYGQERLEDGTFSRPEPEPATVWADDLFMSLPFLLRMAEASGDEQLYDEVVHQVLRFNHYLMDPATGLYFHGWYEGRQENTPVRWGRANGWIVWATSEVLLHLPRKHPGYKQVLKVFQQHMKALAAVQDPSGMWHQVLDHPETWEETSCTAMFALGMARGARLGWLKKSYGEQALKAWEALQVKIGEDGTVADICRGTGIGEDVDFYAGRKRFDHDPRGLGAVITCGCEIHLLENTY